MHKTIGRVQKLGCFPSFSPLARAEEGAKTTTFRARMLRRRELIFH